MIAENAYEKTENSWMKGRTSYSGASELLVTGFADALLLQGHFFIFLLTARPNR